MYSLPDPTHDAGAFLDAVALAIGQLTAPDARALACALAERHITELEEDEGGTRRMVARVRATKGPVLGVDLEAWKRELQGVAEGIDPDRGYARDRQRAVGVIAAALEACAVSPPNAATLAAVETALASRALEGGVRDDAARAARRKELLARWSWDAVQAEACWLATTLEGGPRALEATATAAPEATAAAPAPPPRSAAEPRVLTLPLAGRTLRFIGVDGNARFRAEVDGRRSLIRSRFELVEIGHGDTTAARSPWNEAPVADLGHLVAALDAGAESVEEGGRTVIAHSAEGAHFRQSETTRVILALTPDGVVEVETIRTSQDESHY